MTVTKQIQDIYCYRDREYLLVDAVPHWAFLPKTYGLQTDAPHSACWRGYWCKFTVSDHLLLQNLYLYNEAGEYPPLLGHEVAPIEGDDPYQSPMMGFRRYRDINLPLSYTGRILLGAECTDEIVPPYGVETYSWEYRTLIELVFYEGALLLCRDHSAAAEEERSRIKAAGGVNIFTLDELSHRILDEEIYGL